MRKTRHSRQAAKPMALANPLFAWTGALLKGGKNVLDSIEEAAKRNKSARVGVVPTADAPAPRRSRRKSASRAKGRRTAKSRRR